MLTQSAFGGPEVVDEAVKVLKVVSENSPDFNLNLETHLFGGCAIDAVGEALPSSTLVACREADAILMGMSRIVLFNLPLPSL
jgi:3-isopropylmalate dehydrogenase